MRLASEAMGVPNPPMLVPFSSACQLSVKEESSTAAVISPIGELAEGDEKCIINNNQIGEVTQRLYDELTGIQWGRIEDTHGWIVPVC